MQLNCRSIALVFVIGGTGSFECEPVYRNLTETQSYKVIPVLCTVHDTEAHTVRLVFPLMVSLLLNKLDSSSASFLTLLIDI